MRFRLYVSATIVVVVAGVIFVGIQATRRRGASQFFDGGMRDGFWSVAVSPDGDTVALGTGDRKLVLLNLESGQEIAAIGGLDRGPDLIRFLPDGKSILSVHAFSLDTLAAAPRPTTLVRWDVESNEHVYAKDCEACYGISIVRSLAVAPNGRLAVIAGMVVPESNTLPHASLIDLETGREIRRYEIEADFSVDYADISEDGKRVVIDEGRGLSVRNLETGEILQRFDCGAPVRKVRFIPNSDSCAICVWDRLLLLNLESGEQIWLPKRNMPLADLAVNDVGTRILVSGQDGVVELRSAKLGQLLHSFPKHRSLSGPEVVFVPGKNSAVIASGHLYVYESLP